jgi:phage-related protein
MLNWLKNAVGWAGNALDDVKNWVVGLFSAVYSYFDGWINWLGNYISDVWSQVVQGYNILARGIGDLYNTVASWVRKTYSDIQGWVVQIWHDLYSYIQDVWQWTTRLIDYLKSWVESLLGNLANWVIKNIWDPLYNSISGLARWITTEGAYVYNLVTHPELLAALIGQYVLGAWLSLGRRYAGVFAKWMIHTMISAAGEIGGILEDFIAAII